MNRYVGSSLFAKEARTQIERTRSSLRMCCRRSLPEPNSRSLTASVGSLHSNLSNRPRKQPRRPGRGNRQSGPPKPLQKGKGKGKRGHPQLRSEGWASRGRSRAATPVRTADATRLVAARVIRWDSRWPTAGRARRVVQHPVPGRRPCRAYRIIRRPVGESLKPGSSSDNPGLSGLIRVNARSLSLCLCTPERTCSPSMGPR